MVTTIQEVNIQQAYVQGTGLTQVRALSPEQIVGYDNWQDAITIWDEIGDLDPQPSHTNADFIVWENARLLSLTNEAAVGESKNGLKEKIAFAQLLHSEIKTVFNAILEETETQTVQPARYNTLRALVDSQSGTFKNRFNNDLLQEARIDSSTISTDSQHSTYCLYLRTWITGLVILLALT